MSPGTPPSVCRRRPVWAARLSAHPCAGGGFQGPARGAESCTAADPRRPHAPPQGSRPRLQVKKPGSGRNRVRETPPAHAEREGHRLRDDTPAGVPTHVLCPRRSCCPSGGESGSHSSHLPSGRRRDARSPCPEGRQVGGGRRQMPYPGPRRLVQRRGPRLGLWGPHLTLGVSPTLHPGTRASEEAPAGSANPGVVGNVCATERSPEQRERSAARGAWAWPSAALPRGRVGTSGLPPYPGRSASGVRPRPWSF